MKPLKKYHFMLVNYTLYIRDSTNHSKLNENFKENENIINYNDENNDSKVTETNIRLRKNDYGR